MFNMGRSMLDVYFFINAHDKTETGLLRSSIAGLRAHALIRPTIPIFCESVDIGAPSHKRPWPVLWFRKKVSLPGKIDVPDPNQTRVYSL